MLGLPEDFYLAVGALCVGRVLESIEYFLEGENLLGVSVFNLPNMAIGARPDLLDDVKSAEDMAFDMSAIGLIHGNIIIIC